MGHKPTLADLVAIGNSESRLPANAPEMASLDHLRRTGSQAPYRFSRIEPNGLLQNHRCMLIWPYDALKQIIPMKKAVRRLFGYAGFEIQRARPPETGPFDAQKALLRTILSRPLSSMSERISGKRHSSIDSYLEDH
jgi:hypothetical protein